MLLYFSSVYSSTDISCLFSYIPPEKSGSPDKRSRAVAYALLAYALKYDMKISTPPVFATLPGGKPFFLSLPDVHFSLSHTSSHVLCAVSRSPIGADVETLRDIDVKVIERVMSPSELTAFRRAGQPKDMFFDLWTLKESALKLDGEPGVSLRSLSFSLLSGSPSFDAGGLSCRLFRDIPGCTAAVCSHENELPEHIVEVPLSALLSI